MNTQERKDEAAHLLTRIHTIFCEENTEGNMARQVLVSSLAALVQSVGEMNNDEGFELARELEATISKHLSKSILRRRPKWLNDALNDTHYQHPNQNQS